MSGNQDINSLNTQFTHMAWWDYSGFDYNANYHHITSGFGRVVQWVFFGEMLGYSLFFALIAITRAPAKRPMYYIGAMVCMISAIAYYTMAEDHGYVIRLFLGEYGVSFRQVWFARYVMWALCFPLIIMTLLFWTVNSWMLWAWTIFCESAWIVTFLIGALDPKHDDRWGYFAFGCVFWALTVYGLLVPGNKGAKELNRTWGGLHMSLALIVTLSWIFIPVIYGLSEASNILHPNLEVLFYALVDFFSMPFLYTVLLLGFDRASKKDHDLEARIQGWRINAPRHLRKPDAAGHTHGVQYGDYDEEAAQHQHVVTGARDAGITGAGHHDVKEPAGANTVYATATPAEDRRTDTPRRPGAVV